jgi:hypothetical protein
MESYVNVMRDARWTHWKRDYLVNKPSPILPVKQSILDDFLAHSQNGVQRDEFEVYYTQTCPAVDPSVPIDLVEWWWNNQGNFPTFFQHALDKLTIPAMSAECERVFPGAGKTITPERNRLGNDIIEAGECLTFSSSRWLSSSASHCALLVTCARTSTPPCRVWAF